MINSIYGRIRNFWRIKFIKDAFTLQIGSVFGTALSFLASIIYARILGPADYGVYVLIFSLVSLVGAAESWGEGYALLTLLSAAWGKRDKAEIKSLVLFFIKISLLEFVFIGLIAFILAPTVSLWLYQNSKIGQLARWILLANIIQFIFSLLTIILQSARKIKQLTLLENINKLVYLIIPVGLVLFGLGLNGIVIGNLLSSVIFLIFSIYLYSVLAKKTSLLPSIKEIFVGLRGVKITKYLKFSILIAVDKNLANFYSSLPMVFLGMFVVPENIAFFKIAFSYVGLSLISLKGVSRLLLVQLPKSRIYGMAELKKHFFKTTIYSVVIVEIVIVPMLLLAKWLVELFYGSDYSSSVTLIYIIWPYVLISAAGVGLGPLFRALDKVKVAVAINIISLVVTVPIFYLMIKNYYLLGMAITVIFSILIPILLAHLYFLRYFKKLSQ